MVRAGRRTSDGVSWKPAPAPSSRYVSDSEAELPFEFTLNLVWPTPTEPNGRRLTFLLSGSAVPKDAPIETACELIFTLFPPTSIDGPKPSERVPPGHTCHLLFACSGIAYPSEPWTPTLLPSMPS